MTKVGQPSISLWRISAGGDCQGPRTFDPKVLGSIPSRVIGLAARPVAGLSLCAPGSGRYDARFLSCGFDSDFALGFNNGDNKTTCTPWYRGAGCLLQLVDPCRPECARPEWEVDVP